MILVHQRYYAKPGMAPQVLATRRKADRTLRELGLPVGRTYVLHVQTEGSPDVIWECTYETLDDRRRVEAVLDASPEFTVVRREQGEQLARFSREYFELDSPMEK